ncbi:MAG: GNVR domain-containing protein [Candidatus Omnitrophota bacterium]
MEEVKSNFDLTHFLRLIVKKKWFVIAPIVVLTVSFSVSSFFFPKAYRARAIILIEESNVVNPLLGGLAITSPVKEKIRALREEMLSWPRIFQLVEKLGMSEESKSPLEVEMKIASIRNSISLEMRTDNVVVISYTGSDPFKTQKLVNTLCDILIAQNAASQIEETGSAIEFINEQLTIYKGKLDVSEKLLREFKEVYGFHMISVNDGLETNASAGPNSESTIGMPIMRVNQELAELRSELVMAQVDCTENHPRVVGLKRRIDSLREERNLHIKEVAAAAGIDADLFVNIADSAPRQQEELARLTRDKATNEKLYAMLLERLETAKITERLDSSDNRRKFKVIEPARLPYRAAKPNKALISLIGLLLGCGVGFGSVYLMDFLNLSFKNEDQLKEYYQHPVLGNISRIMTSEDLLKSGAIGRRVIPLVGLSSILLTAAIILASKYF